MGNNTKILIFIVILLIIGGLVLIYFFPSRSQTTNYPLREASPLQATSSAVLVTKVIDGDTFDIEGGKRVRLLGIDTPETKDPRKPVQCFGKEASNKSKGLLEGKSVILEKDITDTDKYNRWLRYVYLPLSDGTMLFVNDFLIREGYGLVLTIPPNVKFADQLLEAQKQARMEKRGLWQKCW